MKKVGILGHVVGQIKADTNVVTISKDWNGIFIGWGKENLCYLVNDDRQYKLSELPRSKVIDTIPLKESTWVHARLTEDGGAIIITWKGVFGQEQYYLGALYAVNQNKVYDLPQGIIAQGHSECPKNASIKEFIYPDGLMYRAIYDEGKKTLYFGHTLSSSFEAFNYGFRRGLRTSTIESYNLNKKEHKIHYRETPIKANWTVDANAEIIWWSPVIEKDGSVTWNEYIDRRFTGRTIKSNNHMWPIMETSEKFIVPKMKGNYELIGFDTVSPAIVYSGPWAK